MLSAMTTAPGSAACCRRAARLGVSPVTASSFAAPSPSRSPTTTRPVAIPMRAASGAPAPADIAADGRSDREAGSNGSLGRVFARLRPAEIGQHAITQELRDVALQPRNLPRHRVLVSAHDVAQLFRIDPSAEIDRSDKIHEHDCELTTLGRRRRWARRQVCRKKADRFEHLSPVTDGLDTDLLEIVDRQARQDIKVDAVVPERLLVGLQAEAAKPFSDVQLRLPLDLSPGPVEHLDKTMLLSCLRAVCRPERLRNGTSSAEYKQRLL